MQLRVARLCLDCEELHADKRCPRCASASFAFVTNWLPCEERRRFGRNRTAADATAWRLSILVQSITRWFRGEIQHPPAPATRRSDFVPELLKLDESRELQLPDKRGRRGHEDSPAADA